MLKEENCNVVFLEETHLSQLHHINWSRKSCLPLFSTSAGRGKMIGEGFLVVIKWFELDEQSLFHFAIGNYGIMTL